MQNIRNLTFLLLTCTLISGLSAQEANFDSLITRHLDETLSERERLDALIELGKKNFLNIYPDSLIQLYQDAEPIFEAIGTEHDLLMQKVQLAGAYFRTSQSEESLHHAERAADLARKLKDTMVLVQALEWQGINHGQAQRLQRSADLFLETLRLVELIDYQRGIASILGNLGYVFQLIEDYDKAKVYLERAIEVHREQGAVSNEIRALMNLGKIYLQEENYSKALALFFEAKEKTATGVANGSLKLSVLQDIGNAYFLQGNTDLAKKYLLESLYTAETDSIEHVISKAQYKLARVYQKSQPDSAFYFAKQAYATAMEYNETDPIFFADVYSVLSELYEERKEYDKALYNYKESNTLRDSVDRSNGEREIYQAEAKYEFEKKELANQITHEQEMAQQQLIAQRRFFLLIGGAILIILVLVALFLYRQNRAKQEYRELLLQIDLLKERLANQSIAMPETDKEVQLDKDKIENYLGKPLNETSWNILITIFQKPSIGNRELAQRVYLSLDGLSSALRRLYKAFQVKTENSRNKKVALLTRVVKISLNQT